jgi:hypothetical protein
MTTTKARACAAQSAASPLASATIPRREPTPRDVKMDIPFRGLGHSDPHYARNVWTCGGTDHQLHLPTSGGYSENTLLDEHFLIDMASLKSA